MYSVTMPKQESNKLVIPAPIRVNFLPIAVQISLAQQGKRYNKRNNRAKQKRRWQDDQ